MLPFPIKIPPATTELSYEPREEVVRKRAFFRRVACWVLGVLIAVVLVAVALRVGVTAYDYTNMRYSQRECLSFELPADSIVYAEDIAGRDAAMQFVRRRRTTGATDVVPHKYLDDDGSTEIVHVRPTAEFNFNRSAGVVFGPDVLTVFMHGRRATPGGPERLVRTGLSIHRTGRPARLPGGIPTTASQLVAEPYSLATAGRTLRPLPPSHVAVAGIAAVPLGDLRLYAGQPDPADESHFTIDYETPDGRGTIDGWLMPDDTVKLEVRDGPAAGR